MIEGNSTNTFLKPLTSVKEHQLSLPIILIGIVEFAFTLVWDNLCRNSRVQNVTNEAT